MALKRAAGNLWSRIKDDETRLALEELASLIANMDGFPQGGIIISLAGMCPTGFSQVTDLAGYHVRGVPTGGTVGDIIGDDAPNVEAGPGDGTVSNVTRTGAATVADDSHNHYFEVPTVPLSRYVLFCKKD